MKIRLKRHPVSRLLLGAFMLSAASVYTYQVQAATDQPPIPRGVAMKSWHDNGRDGRYLLQLAQGSALKAGKPVSGTVTGDANCDADAEGLSHCHNTVKLANGSQITVINTHEMHRYRCLGPGDSITLSAIGGPWIMGALPVK